MLRQNIFVTLAIAGAMVFGNLGQDVDSLSLRPHHITGPGLSLKAATQKKKSKVPNKPTNRPVNKPLNRPVNKPTGYTPVNKLNGYYTPVKPAAGYTPYTPPVNKPTGYTPVNKPLNRPVRPATAYTPLSKGKPLNRGPLKLPTGGSRPAGEKIQETGKHHVEVRQARDLLGFGCWTLPPFPVYQVKKTKSQGSRGYYKGEDYEVTHFERKEARGNMQPTGQKNSDGSAHMQDKGICTNMYKIEKVDKAKGNSKNRSHYFLTEKDMERDFVEYQVSALSANPPHITKASASSVKKPWWRFFW